MADVPIWVDALKISREDYSEWLEIFPSPEYVLSWAIESKRVDEMQYMRWASRHYKLPVVKPEFFQQQPPLDIWKKYLGGPWSPTVLPLYEWQGTLFVGVLEPKNFVLDNIKVQLVIAPSTAQNSWWHAFTQLRKSDVTPPPLPAEVPPPVVAETPKAEVMHVIEQPVTPLGLEEAMPEMAPVSEFEIVEPEAVEVVEEPASLSPTMDNLLKPEKKIDLRPTQEIPVPKAEAFDTLEISDITPTPDLSPEGISFDLSSLPPVEAPPAFEEDPSPAGLEVAPQLLSHEIPTMNPEGLEGAEVPQVALGQLENLISDEPSPPPQLAPPAPAPKAAAPAPTPSLKPPIAPLGTSLATPVAAPVAAPKLAPPVVMAPPPVVATPTPPPPPPPEPPAPSPTPEMSGPPPVTGVPEGAIKQALAKLKPLYEKGMVLIRHEEKLTPYQWDPDWRAENLEKSEVELDQPSLFRIVVDSKQPFHGNARPCPPNDKFFKVWNKSKYPTLVTALPLKTNEEVFGVLLAVSSAQQVPNVLLIDMEKLAQDLSEELAKSSAAA